MGDTGLGKMAHLRKIQKDNPDALEISVAQALGDLQMNLNEIRDDLAPLTIMSAREIDVTTNKKAIIIMVPFIQLAQFRKIQPKLVRELEKKFSGRHVVFVANRRILKKPAKNNQVKRQKRPFSRTVTAVHTAILEDLTYPVDRQEAHPRALRHHQAAQGLPRPEGAAARRDQGGHVRRRVQAPDGQGDRVRVPHGMST